MKRNVGVDMFVAHRAMERRVHAAVEAAGFDVTLAQGRIAARIGPEGTRLTELAAQAQVTKQTAGVLVDQLERAGVVERVADPDDRRARLIRFTELGRQAVAIGNAEAAAVEKEWAELLGARRMAALRDALTVLREVTDPDA